MDKKIGKDPHISIRLPRAQIAYATRLAKEQSVSRSALLIDKSDKHGINAVGTQRVPVLAAPVSPDQRAGVPFGPAAPLRLCHFYLVSL